MASNLPPAVQQRIQRRRDQQAATQAASAYSGATDALGLAMAAIAQANNVRGMVLNDRNANGARYATIAQLEAAVAELRGLIDALSAQTVAGKAGDKAKR